jgi:hypothetical protein
MRCLPPEPPITVHTLLEVLPTGMLLQRRHLTWHTSSILDGRALFATARRSARFVFRTAHYLMQYAEPRLCSLNIRTGAEDCPITIRCMRSNHEQ